MDHEHRLGADKAAVYTIQPQKEDATQGVDKDSSINSHAMVENEP
jgi:hypothetical protein